MAVAAIDDPYQRAAAARADADAALKTLERAVSPEEHRKACGALRDALDAVAQASLQSQRDRMEAAMAEIAAQSRFELGVLDVLAAVILVATRHGIPSEAMEAEL